MDATTVWRCWQWRSLPLARAELTEIQWGFGRALRDSGEHRIGIVRRSLRLAGEGQSVVWSFKGGAPMNLNIHYHEGKQVALTGSRTC